MNIFFLLIFSSVPYNSIATIECNSVQVNHFYNDSGKLVIDQLLCSRFIEFEEGYREVIVCWILLNNSRISDDIKKRKWEADPKHKDIPYVPDYVQEFEINNKTIILPQGENLVKIKFDGLFSESWTQYDPELVNRGLYPKEVYYVLPTYYHKEPSQINIGK